MVKAVAIRRVSSKKQEENNHSLNQQDTSVQSMAGALGAEIVMEWAMATSAKKGKNLERPDLKLALNYCRYNRGVKYLLVAKVSRFMRELKMLFHYMVEFEKLGVKVVFCDPSQQKYNADTADAMYELAKKAYQAEAENEERSETSTTKMQERVRLGYYPFYPHQGYKKTDAADGLHVPDQPRFSLLQKALKATASLEMTPKEAQLWLASNGYRTPVIYRKDKDGNKIRKGERILDLNHFTEIMKDPYYAKILEINDWPVNKNGLHQAMITVEELEINIAIAKGRKIRRKQRYNPDFKLNLSFHEPCVNNDGKLTGINHTNGKGWSRKEYVCRACKKRVVRDDVHASMTMLLENLTPRDEGVTELKKALKQVWENGEAYRIDRMKSLESRMVELTEVKSQMVRSLSANPDLGEDIKDEIAKIKAEITDVGIQIAKDSDVDAEFDEFAEFALDYTENLRKRWWDLPDKQLDECKQLVFKDKIIVQPSGNVYTPDLSYIYTLITNKKDLKEVNFSNMVELVGTAPTSAGLTVGILQV